MEYVNDLFKPQVTSADACAASGITIETLKNWVLREPSPILLDRNERKKIGGRKLFAFPILRVLQIAITAQLVALGLPVRRAGMLAIGFTDVGDIGIIGVQDKQREPGELYKTGFTYLVADADSDRSRIINIKNASDALDCLNTQAGPAIFLKLDTVVAQVLKALNVRFQT